MRREFIEAPIVLARFRSRCTHLKKISRASRISLSFLVSLIASTFLPSSLVSAQPVITVVGANPVTVECGSDYVDAGATAVDAEDGDVTASIVVVDSVNTAVPGQYTVTYDVTDSDENAAVQTVRTVDVVDTVGPVIELMGLNPEYYVVGNAYVEAGATAIDACDGELTGQIVIECDVDTETAGMYTCTYTATDGSGNESEVSRMVIVSLEDADVCESVGEVIDLEWELLKEDLNLFNDIPEAPGNQIPERWALAMVQEVICFGTHPIYQAVAETYQQDLDSLVTESEEIAARVDPYKHVLSLLLLVNQTRQVHFISLLGLTKEYSVVRNPSRETSPEVLGDDGDLDGDGRTNAEEYEIVIGNGGDIDDFADSVIKGALALSLATTLVVLLTLVAMSLVRIRNRKHTGAL